MGGVIRTPEYLARHWTSKRRWASLRTRNQSKTGKWLFQYSDRSPVGEFNQYRWDYDPTSVTGCGGNFN